MESKGVKIKKLVKIYPTSKGKEFRAVDDVSIDIEPGEFVTLLGPSGCGKTTTLRMIAGFETPTSGDIYIGEDRINNLPPNKRDSSMVFQSYALFPHYNVYDNIAYGLKIRKMNKSVIKEKVENIIELVGLKDMENRFPNQLSGGQQQRVALARALIMEPKVLLFDEPLSNLDAKLRNYMRTEIRKIQKKVNITAIYVTHDQSEAMSLSDRIIIMNKGKIEQIGSPMEIYYRPKNEFVADFIGIANIININIESVENDQGLLNIFGEKIWVPYNGEIGKRKAIIRPEAIQIGKKGLIRGKVILSTFMGSYQDYVININGMDIKIQDGNPQEKEKFTEGEEAYISFNTKHVHII
jgi:iron(III) transport system ATP-binding protein